MGLQYQLDIEEDSGNVVELRAESVILYDGTWYNNNTNKHIFANGETSIQSVEITKEYLRKLLEFFDDDETREEFGIY